MHVTLSSQGSFRCCCFSYEYISIQIPLLIVPFFEIYIGEVHQNCTVKLFRQLPCHAVMKHPTFFAQLIYSECKFRSTIMQPNWFFDLNAQCTCYKMKHRHYFKCKLLFHWVNIIMPNFSLQDPRALKLLLMWAQWQINRGSIDLNSNSDDVTFWFLGTIQFL